MCPNINNTEVVAQFNAIVQRLGGQPLTIEEFKSAELRAQRIGTNYAAMELAYRIWDANHGEIDSVDEVVRNHINQPQNSLKQQIDAINKRLPNDKVAEHLMSAKISGILSELFPELSVEYVTSLSNGHIGEIDLCSLKVLVDFVKGKRDSLPHEYAHYYYNMFRYSDLMKKGIEVFGTEEALVDAIGKKVVELEGKQRSWLQKFIDFIKAAFNKKYAKDALLCEITDAFLQRKDLGNKTYALFGIRYQSDEEKSTEEVQLILKKMNNDIIYVDETHSYSTVNGMKLTSVSDRKKEYGLNTYDDSLEDMDQKQISKQARERGSAIHAIFEDVFKGNFSPAKYEEFGITPDAAMTAKFIAENLLNYYDFVASEAIVYDESIRTAGTLDLMMRDKKTGEYVLFDFKTKPRTLNGKNINKKGNKMHGFDFVNSKKYNPKSHNDEYNFQLSLYAEMLSKRGIKIARKAIIPILYDVVESASGKQSLTKIVVSSSYGSMQDEQGSFVSKPLNDSKAKVQWVAEDKAITNDIIKARLYKDLSGFDNETQAKRYLNAVDEASKLIATARGKLQTQLKVQQAKGRNALAYKTSRQLQRMEDLKDLDALLSFVQFASENLKSITEILGDFAKKSDNPDWSLSKLSQYYTISQAYNMVSEIRWYLNSYGNLFDDKLVNNLKSQIDQMARYIDVVHGYYNREAKQKYLDKIVKGTKQYKARLIEKESDKWTQQHRSEYKSSKELRKARKDYIDKWIVENEEYLNAKQAEWLEAQTRLADSVFEVNDASAWASSVYEITDPFVTASVRIFDEGMQEVMHKTIAMRTRLDKATKAYLSKYGFGNLSDMKKVFEDFYEITDNGSCYLVTSIPSSYRRAVELFDESIRQEHTLTADKRRQKRRQWQDENNPITDKAAYDEEFKTELINYLEKEIDDDKLFEKTYNEIMENYKSNKMTWQKMLFVEKTTLTNDIADFVIKLQQNLDIKYRKPSSKYSNEKYDKMMSLDKTDPKRVLWELLNEICGNEHRYRLPYRMRLKGRLPACNKSSYETLRTGGIIEATKLGMRDAFTVLEEEQEALRGEFIDELGNRVRQIAMPFVSHRIKEDKQSFNLPDIFLRYYEAAETYRVKSKMEEILLYTQSILNSRQTKDKHGRGLHLTNTAKMYQKWLDQVFYDERLKDYGGFSIGGGVRIDYAKFVKKIANFHSNKAMAFNMIAAISNVLQGETGNLEEAFAGKHITLNALHKASKIFAKEVPEMLADAYRVTPQSKINKLAQWMHVFDGTENITIRGVMSNSLGDYTHMLSTFGEHWIQGRFMIAYFLNKDALDENGNVIGNMWDMIDFDENNQIKIDSRVANMSAAQLNEMSFALRRILIQMNGNYDQKRNANALENTIAGPLVMGLRRWVAPGFRRAWGPKSYDDILDSDVSGIFTTLLNWVVEDATPNTILYFNKNYDKAKYARWRARKWGELQDWEREHLIKAFTRLALTALALLAYSVFGSAMGDDDDDNTVAVTSRYLSYRLYADLSFVYNPIAFNKIIRDPFPALGLVDNIADVFGQFANPGEEYYSGQHMIDNKLLDKLSRLLPGARQLYRFENIKNEMRYFISGN